MISVDKDVEKRAPLYTAGGNVNWRSPYGKQYHIAQNIKNRTTIQSSNSTSGYLYEENKNTNSKGYMHTYMFTAALVTIAKI